MIQALLHRFKERRYGVLLCILLMLLAGPPILAGFGLSAAWFDGLMSALMLAGIISLCFERKQRLFVLLLGTPSIAISLGGQIFASASTNWVLLLGHLCEVLFLFGSAVLIIKSLFGTGPRSFDSILGAVCGYLFVGLGWAVIYSMIESLRPGSFSMGQSLAPFGETAMSSDVLTYYSFITLTTVGYGDVAPISSATRTCAWLEAITGQFYLAVIVAGIVSMLVSRTSTSQDASSGDLK